MSGVVVLFGTLLAGCGQPGPLYLPKVPLKPAMAPPALPILPQAVPPALANPMAPMAAPLVPDTPSDSSPAAPATQQ